MSASRRCGTFLALTATLWASASLAEEGVRGSSVTAGSSYARAAARTVIVNPTTVDCERALRSVTVGVAGVRAGDVRLGDTLRLSCTVEAGRAVVSVASSDFGKRIASAGPDSDLMLLWVPIAPHAGTDGLAAGPHVVEVLQNFE